MKDQQSAEAFVKSQGGSSAEYAGKESTVDNAYVNEGDKRTGYYLNADGSVTKAGDGKPSVTKVDLANSEPEIDVAGAVAGGSGNLLEKINGHATAIGTEAALIDAGLTKGIGAAEDLGKNLKVASGIARGIGTAAALVNGVYATAQLIDNPTKGNAARVTVQAVAAGAAFIPGVGWGIALGIGIADVIWGDDLYNRLDGK